MKLFSFKRRIRIRATVQVCFLRQTATERRIENGPGNSKDLTDLFMGLCLLQKLAHHSIMRVQKSGKDGSV